MVTALAAQNWALFVLRGILALIFGTLAFVAPGPTFAALIFVFAFYAIVDGVFAVAAGLAAMPGPRWLLVIGGILAVAIGVYTGFNPTMTATAVVLLVGAFVLVRGIAEIGTALVVGSVVQSVWLLFLSGLISVVFGAYLLVAPNEGALALVFVVGFYALFAGVMYIAMGLQLRDVAKAIEQTVASQSPQTTSRTQATAA